MLKLSKKQKNTGIKKQSSIERPAGYIDIPDMVSHTPASSLKYYSSINNLPCGIFWDIATEVCGIEGLVISGSVPRETLLKAWEGINVEYASIVDPNNSQKTKEEYRITSLRYKISMVAAAVTLLRAEFDQKIFDLLSEQVPTIKLDHTKPGYLDKIFPLYNRWKMEVERLEAFKIKTTVGKKKMTRNDYLEIALEIERELHIPISENDTIAKYALAYRKYQLVIKAKEAANKGNGRRNSNR